jgi:hypothetical protein
MECWSQYWFTFSWCNVELCIQIITKIISKIKCISNSILNLLILIIRFPINKINMSMCPHERIENPKLIEHNEQFVSWFTIEPWDISTHKLNTSKAKCHQLIQWYCKFSNICLVITCPFCSIFLSTEECGSC